MADWWTSLTIWDQVYWGCAALASILLILVLLVSVLGADSDFEGEVDLSNSGFQDFSILSIKSILSFFTMFGWAGVLFSKTEIKTTTVLALALVFGFAALFLVGYLTNFLQNLSESGTFDIQKIINKTATVYLTIPGENKEKGKIHLIIDGTLKEFAAWTYGETIPNGQIVEIIGLTKNNEAIVNPILKNS